MAIILSLKESAEDKIITTSMLNQNSITISTIISVLYDAARELLEALAFIKGYKINNHECYFAFMKSIKIDDRISEIFNRARLLRNRINYYGFKVSLEDGELMVKNINELIFFTKNKLQEEINKGKIY
ncbi:MAG: hypothetical protein ACP5N2_01455 [Candidatus Nanoarchaeia archaeon]